MTYRYLNNLARESLLHHYNRKIVWNTSAFQILRSLILFLTKNGELNYYNRALSRPSSPINPIPIALISR
jgi:hypothetical protein